MYSPLEVRKDIYWVGALDYHIRTFDIVMYTEYGTTYNSYVVKGSEKTLLAELSKESFYHQFIARLEAVVDPKSIDYILVSHAEPDHSGTLYKLLELNPNVKIVATPTCIKFLKQIVNRDFNSIPVKSGDTLSLGDRTLEFTTVPFLHWPDTLYSYSREDKTLFTCDSFGCHYCDERVFNDQITGDFLEAYKYYFDNIMGPFKPFVLEAIDKIKHLEIETICNGHGPVIRTNPEKYIEMYKQWATVSKRERKSVVIPYVTSYGYTRKIAEKIAEGIKTEADIDVFVFDLIKADKSEVMKEINEASGLLFGSPTLVGDALPPIWEILISLNPIIHKGKTAGAFGSYGWSGEAVPNIIERLKQLKFKLPLEGLKICFNPSEAELQKAFEFGKQFAKAL